MFTITVCVLFYIVNYAVGSEDAAVSYEGAQVWRTALRDADDILMMKKLIDSQDVSIWSLSPKNADFLIYPEGKVKVHRLLNSRNLNHTVLVMNVQRKIDTLKPEPVMWDDTTLRAGHRLTWTTYPTLKNVDEYFNFLSENYPSVCNVQHIGYSTEGRSIKMAHVTNGNPKNKAVLVTAGIHAREWITVTSGLYILNKIVTEFDQLPDFIKNTDWYIVPLVNPDGYLYSYTQDRLWRKNRRKFSQCIGVDINRNFEKDWYINGITEYDECKSSYAGPNPFSERESIALRDVILKNKDQLGALLDLHSFGQLILFPWSARSKETPDARLHKTIAVGMSKAIISTTKLIFKSGPTYHLIYPATGSLLDWVFASGVKLAYAIEGRDTGTHGFLLPPEHIEDAGKEMFSAVTHLAKKLKLAFIKRGTTKDPWFK